MYVCTYDTTFMECVYVRFYTTVHLRSVYVCTFDTPVHLWSVCVCTFDTPVHLWS